MTCRFSFNASTDKIFKHSVYCVLPSLYSIIGHILCTSRQMYAVLFFHLFAFSAETLHPLSKNVYILNSLSTYQRVHVVVFTSTSTVW